MTQVGCPQYSLKYYREDLYKLIKFSSPLMPRMSQPREAAENDDRVNEDGKFLSAISRAKSVIYQVGVCNDWDWFCTFTINKEKFDRYDFKPFYKAFTQWIRDYRKKYKCKIEYCLIPEPHQDGAWHLHGFFRGIPDAHLTDFVPGMHPDRLCNKGYKNWGRCSNKFGFCSLGVLRDPIKAAGYVTKYITKDLLKKNRGFGAHLYMCSLGLKRAISLGYVYGEHFDLDRRLSSYGTFCSTGWVKPEDDIPLWVWVDDYLPHGSFDVPIMVETFDEDFVDFVPVQLDFFEEDDLCADYGRWLLPV